jgi:uncharacterized membrane protein
MQPTRPRLSSILGTVGAAMGLFFAAFSTHDYAQHLDRQLHGTHCSFIPGLTDAEAGANACTAAMYSPYSAIFRTKYWGGIPISLFALGAFAFFLAWSITLLTAGNAASKRNWQAFGVAAFTPGMVSLLMFFISLTKLNGFCKLCVGMYVSSLTLAVGGALALKHAAGPKSFGADDTLLDPSAVPPGYPQPAYAVPETPPAALGSLIPTGTLATVAGLFIGLGFAALLPSMIYVSKLPDYRPFLLSCGKIVEATESHSALVKIPTTQPVQPALLFVDPLCPTCKQFHDRLVSEGAFEHLEVNVAIFPLDSDCNWMLDRSLHPGACVLAKAFLCGDKAGTSRQILEWSYAHQDELRDAGKAGKELVRAKVKAQFPDVDACIDAKETKQRLDRILQFAVTNKIPISTPQFFLGETRICDEDTDMGLPYTLHQLAPQVMP